MQRSTVSLKAEEFHKQMARTNRQAIFAKHRREILRKINQQQYPITSHILSKYSQVPANKLRLYRDQIFDDLDNIDGEQLSEEQSQELSRDLLNLLSIDSEFLIPYTMKFRKDESQLTATVVAFVYECIDPQEGNYWLKFMNEDCRSTLYLNLQCRQEQDMTKWLQDLLFLQTLVQDWGQLEEAEATIAQLLTANIQQIIQFFESVYQKLQQMNKEHKLKLTPNLLLIIVRLMQNFRSEKKKFSYLKILLNESIINLYQERQNIVFENDEFLYSVEVLMRSSKQSCIPIFTQQAFNIILQVLINSCYLRLNEIENKKQRSNISQEKLQQVRQNYQLKVQSRLINICMDYLRINRLFKFHSSINQNLLKPLQPNNTTKQYQKFQKLVDFNANLKKEHQKAINNFNSKVMENIQEI